MISINANIRSGWFAAIFFGSPIVVLLYFITTFRTKNRENLIWVACALVFAIVTTVVTFTQHLPLNNQLENGLSWQDYIAPWLQWNHVRTATSLLAFALMLGACTVKYRR
ncbi:MAG: anthrone oxygenase family protein [Granulosicoccus sp.]